MLKAHQRLTTATWHDLAHGTATSIATDPLAHSPTQALSVDSSHTDDGTGGSAPPLLESGGLPTGNLSSASEVGAHMLSGLPATSTFVEVDPATLTSSALDVDTPAVKANVMSFLDITPSAWAPTLQSTTFADVRLTATTPADDTSAQQEWLIETIVHQRHRQAAASAEPSDAAGVNFRRMHSEAMLAASRLHLRALRMRATSDGDDGASAQQDYAPSLMPPPRPRLRLLSRHHPGASSAARAADLVRRTHVICQRRLGDLGDIIRGYST